MSKNKIHKISSTEEQYLEEEKPKKNIFLKIMGIFLVILIFSYYFYSYPVFDILQGQASSIKLVNNIIESNNIRIVFLNNTEEIINKIHSKEQETKLKEIALCFLGNIEELNNKSVYFVEQIYYPEIKDSSFRHVEFSGCPKETIIMFHTHPYKRCLASDVDIETLKNSQQTTNPNLIMLIACEDERFTLISQ